MLPTPFNKCAGHQIFTTGLQRGEESHGSRILTGRDSLSLASGPSGGTPVLHRFKTHRRTVRPGVRPASFSLSVTFSLPVYEAILPVSSLIRKRDLKETGHRHAVTVPVHQPDRGSPGQPCSPRLNICNLQTRTFMMETGGIRSIKIPALLSAA